jgi:hypothetical protein
MSYERVGSYDGPLQAMADKLQWLSFKWLPGDYGTTPQDLLEVRDAYQEKLSEAIPGEWVRSMLVAIKPGGNIRMHNDIPPKDSERFHLVLATNDRCWNFHDGDWQQLDLGGIYNRRPAQATRIYQLGVRPCGSTSLSTPSEGRDDMEADPDSARDGAAAWRAVARHDGRRVPRGRESLCRGERLPATIPTRLGLL